MGRAVWLRGNQDEALREIEEALGLSPNFALGHYTLGFVHAQSGDPHIAISSANYSRHLSPFDPLMFAMLCSRALGHLRLGQYQEAADWAMKGAARPNAAGHFRARDRILRKDNDLAECDSAQQAFCRTPVDGARSLAAERIAI